MANETGKKKGQRSCIACGKQAGKAALFSQAEVFLP